MKQTTQPIGERISLTIDPKDNVATILDSAETLTRASGIDISPAIPFGHKFALIPIQQGAQIIKYGVVIGTATADIAAGEHVHVHNIA
jgi:altronate dehydratase